MPIKSVCLCLIVLLAAIAVLPGCGVMKEIWYFTVRVVKAAANIAVAVFTGRSKEGVPYRMDNKSSKTVFLEDKTGSVYLKPGQTWTGYFNKDANIADVKARTDSGNAKVEQTLNTFTFTD